jgi:hypothetical protein
MELCLELLKQFFDCAFVLFLKRENFVIVLFLCSTFHILKVFVLLLLVCHFLLIQGYQLFFQLLVVLVHGVGFLLGVVFGFLIFCYKLLVLLGQNVELAGFLLLHALNLLVMLDLRLSDVCIDFFRFLLHVLLQRFLLFLPVLHLLLGYQHDTAQLVHIKDLIFRWNGLTPV